MRRHLLLTTLSLAAVLQAQTSPAPTTAWLGGSWFDGERFVMRDVYTVAGAITLKRPAHVARTVDLSGSFVTPAFGEGHNHNIPGADTERTIRDYVSKGILYVMIQENRPGALTQLSSQINAPGKISVKFANGAFTAPGGHPSALVERGIRNGGMSEGDRDGGFLVPVASKEEVSRQWTRHRQQRPDFIKMMLAYSDERARGWVPPAGTDRYGLDPGLPSEITKLAHRDGLRVSAHVESAGDFAIAVAARADLIAHMPGFWPDPARLASKGAGIYRIKEESARRAGRQHTTVITTLSDALNDLATNKTAIPYRDAMLDVYRWNLAVLAKYGVRVVIGSDLYRGTSIPEAALPAS